LKDPGRVQSGVGGGGGDDLQQLQEGELDMSGLLFRMKYSTGGSFVKALRFPPRGPQFERLKALERKPLSELEIKMVNGSEFERLG